MRRFHFPPFKVHKQVHDRVLMEIDMVVKQLQSHRILIKRDITLQVLVVLVIATLAVLVNFYKNPMLRDFLMHRYF